MMSIPSITTITIITIPTSLHMKTTAALPSGDGAGEIIQQAMIDDEALRHILRCGKTPSARAVVYAEHS